MKQIAQYKQRWNAMIRANQKTAAAFSATESSTIVPVVENEMGTFSYHGTATSTTVAHQNETVRLVLVERQLMSEAQVQAGFTCFDQSEINQVTDLLADPAVFAAAAAPTGHAGRGLRQRHGRARRRLCEREPAPPPAPCWSRCRVPSALPIDPSRYFAAITAVDAAHAATLTGPGVLTIRAAGNDGANINTGADALDCNPGDPTTLQVGSYNPANGVQNTFSNFGACIDLFAPGQFIVTMYAGGWLFPVDGTSFAAPLTAWLGSRSSPTPFTVATARASLLANTDATKELPADAVPVRLLLRTGRGVDGRHRRPAGPPVPPCAAPRGRAAGPAPAAGAAAPFPGCPRRVNRPGRHGNPIEKGGGRAYTAAPMASLKLKPGVITGDALKELFAYCKTASTALAGGERHRLERRERRPGGRAARPRRRSSCSSRTRARSFTRASRSTTARSRRRLPAPSPGALHVRTLAKVYGVPVVLHTDHCAKKLLPWVDGVIAAGEEYFAKNGEPLFSSHMLDLSEQPIAENLEISARNLEAHRPR